MARPFTNSEKSILSHKTRQAEGTTRRQWPLPHVLSPFKSNTWKNRSATSLSSQPKAFYVITMRIAHEEPIITDGDASLELVEVDQAVLVLERADAPVARVERVQLDRCNYN